MRYLGKMPDLKWEAPVSPLTVGQEIRLDEHGHPAQVPVFIDGIFLFGILDQGLGKNVFLCESLEDIQHVFGAGAKEWFSSTLPVSSHAYVWESKTGKFSPKEIHLLEVYNVVALKRMLLRHLPLITMRALAELMLHDDPRLAELLADPEVTDHWKQWSCKEAEVVDFDYAGQLTVRTTNITDNQYKSQN